MEPLPHWLTAAIQAAGMTTAYVDENWDGDAHVAPPLLTDSWPPREPPQASAN